MSLFVLMLVILNPFAQVVYLADLLKQMPPRAFAGVHLRATLLSFGVFALFVLTGDWLLTEVFQVRLASLQIFGGLIMLYVAYRYIAVGAGSNLLFRGDIGDLAPSISLPYMVGPGTIWVSIEIGRIHSPAVGLSMVAGVLAANMAVLLLVHQAYAKLQSQKDTILGKYFAILMRTNALFIGAISIEMILLGIDSALGISQANGAS